MSLTAANQARLDTALNKVYNFSKYGPASLRTYLADQATWNLSESDGMIDYNRRTFNRMGSHREQDAYIAKLKAKRLYWINDLQVSKIVYDHYASRLALTGAIFI